MRQKLLDDFNRPYLYLWAVNRWLAFRSDIIGSSVAFLTSLFILVNLHYIDSGAAGLALMYAVTFTEHVLVFIRIYSINEQNMNAVERIQEYFAVPQEETASSPGRDAPPCWPSSGQIEFVDFSAKYSEALPFVLRNISLQINSGERVAVVGRTGSGKTSLALALLRVLEAQHGKILIDHVDVSSIGLHELRSKVVMVPQDPALFTGTIRCNLDPAGLYTDEELLNSLRRVHLLGGTVSLTALSTDALDSCGENGRTFEDLNSAVSESGSNFSQGQRQLLCIARALLRESKILIFDEATASIDHETDMKIQSTIREIRNCTIITVAHRLRTVMDYDSVIVLENGGVSEFGRPRELMFQKDSYFESLCRESGEWDKLVRLASGEILMS
ncbi:MAG: hypothetical protein FE78DRAFT_108685 [Acidomyces sp. 'richmondensis']|nr:MAG: hypothetical protein FE78DRAFT_108685 [Acidomyces sp. 'richmondensis']